MAARPRSHYGAVVLFLGFWMACGWAFRLDPNAYLLLGVPLTFLFQCYVRRRPLRALWVREAPPLRLGWKGIVVAVVLALLPLAGLVAALMDRQWVEGLYSLLSLVGAVGAAYALRHFRPAHRRPFAWCLLITLTLDAIQWSLFLGSGVVPFRIAEGGPLVHVAVGLASLFQYLAVVFVLEEVTFRMLDSHLHEVDDTEVGFSSAVFISALWGLWHLPGEELSRQTVGLLFYVHVPYGACLALAWRKTGNLFIPGFCHALGDAIRNGLTAGG